VESEPELNPAQRLVLDLLGATDAERPTFDPGLGAELRLELERALAPVAAGLADGEQLFVNKHQLSQVHGCEARHLAELDEPFTWTVPKARGTVAHKAIELAVWWKGEPVPADLVAETLAKSAGGSDSLSDWLRTCGDLARAELQGEATERVTSFLECFPPLKTRWRPALEGRMRVELFDGRIILAGKYDLSLGAAQGSTAGKVIVDFKTGGFAPTHVDEMRFYALLDTIKIGTPPRLVATYYLDAARAHPEAVTVDVLEAAVARTGDGVNRIAELAADRELAVKRTGPACRWCPILSECDEGRASVAGSDDPEDW
jgi:PD-(D/E)XK nuclease superfamily